MDNEKKKSTKRKSRKTRASAKIDVFNLNSENKVKTKKSKTTAVKSKSPTQRYNKIMNIKKEKKKPGVNKNDPRLNFCSLKNVFL